MRKLFSYQCPGRYFGREHSWAVVGTKVAEKRGDFVEDEERVFCEHCHRTYNRRNVRTGLQRPSSLAYNSLMHSYSEYMEKIRRQDKINLLKAVQ